MNVERLLSVIWLVGLALVILSWTKVVPPTVGWVGMGITIVTFVVSLLRRRG